MNRRAFLRLLGVAGAGATLDRKYFFAPAAGWGPRVQRFTLTIPKGPGQIHAGEMLVLANHPIVSIDEVWIDNKPIDMKFICAMFQVPIHLVNRGPYDLPKLLRGL